MLYEDEQLAGEYLQDVGSCALCLLYSFNELSVITITKSSRSRTLTNELHT